MSLIACSVLAETITVADIVLVIGVAVAFGMAIKSIAKNKKKNADSHCTGDCNSCSGCLFGH